MLWRSASELGQKYATQNYPSQGSPICRLHGPSIKPSQRTEQYTGWIWTVPLRLQCDTRSLLVLELHRISSTSSSTRLNWDIVRWNQNIFFLLFFVWVHGNSLPDPVISREGVDVFAQIWNQMDYFSSHCSDHAYESLWQGSELPANMRSHLCVSEVPLTDCLHLSMVLCWYSCVSCITEDLSSECWRRRSERCSGSLSLCRRYLHWHPRNTPKEWREMWRVYGMVKLESGEASNRPSLFPFCWGAQSMRNFTLRPMYDLHFKYVGIKTFKRERCISIWELLPRKQLIIGYFPKQS